MATDKTNKKFQKLIEDQISLPSPPAVAVQILETVQNEESSLEDLEKIISADPALTGKMLRVANSAIYSLPNEVSNVSRAFAILGTNVISTSNDREEFDPLVGHLCDSVGKPTTLLADAGYAGEQIVAALDARGIEPLIAVSRQQAERPYDFRPPKEITKPPPKITAPWRIAMQKKLQTDEAKNKYRKRKQTVEPIFGIIKSVLGFTRFHLRGIENVKNEWTLIALAHNCKRLSKLVA